jgi:hypothetical protein
MTQGRYGKHRNRIWLSATPSDTTSSLDQSATLWDRDHTLFHTCRCYSARTPFDSFCFCISTCGSPSTPHILDNQKLVFPDRNFHLLARRFLWVLSPCNWQSVECCFCAILSSSSTRTYTHFSMLTRVSNLPREREEAPYYITLVPPVGCIHCLISRSLRLG